MKEAVRSLNWLSESCGEGYTQTLHEVIICDIHALARDASFANEHGHERADWLLCESSCEGITPMTRMKARIL